MNISKKKKRFIAWIIVLFIVGGMFAIPMFSEEAHKTATDTLGKKVSWKTVEEPVTECEKGKSIVQLKGNYIDCGKKGVNQLNKLRKSQNVEPVQYSANLEAIAQKVIPSYIEDVFGERSHGNIAGGGGITLPMEKFKIEYPGRTIWVGFSVTETSKGMTITSALSTYRPRSSPGIYSKYAKYGAVVRFIPKGSNKTYILTLTSNENLVWGSKWDPTWVPNPARGSALSGKVYVPTKWISNIKITGANSVTVGSTIRLKATCTADGYHGKHPAKLCNSAEWVSSDPSVLTISHDGTVTGIAPGKATVYIRGRSKKNQKKTIIVK